MQIYIDMYIHIYIYLHEGQVALETHIHMTYNSSPPNNKISQEVRTYLLRSADVIALQTHFDLCDMAHICPHPNKKQISNEEAATFARSAGVIALETRFDPCEVTRPRPPPKKRFPKRRRLHSREVQVLLQ